MSAEDKKKISHIFKNSYTKNFITEYMKEESDKILKKEMPENNEEKIVDAIGPVSYTIKEGEMPKSKSWIVI